jgi:hypothetical protein
MTAEALQRMLSALAITGPARIPASMDQSRG